MKFTPNKIILHHSLTKDSETVSWGAIRKYHVEVEGWLDIGYHFGIEQVGDGFEVFAGRPLDRVGAHTKGQNGTSLGVCCVGNYDVDTVPEGMIQKLIPLLRGLMSVFSIPSDQIYRHSDFAPKTCPGSHFPFDRVVSALKIAISG